MLGGGSDLEIFPNIVGVLRQFSFVISHTYLKCLIEMAQYHDNKNKIMKAELKSS